MPESKPKSELLTKAIAAKRLNLSVRRLMELSEQGKIRRHRGYDPVTRREAVMFAVSDVAQLAADWTPAAPAPPASIQALMRLPGVVQAAAGLAARDRERAWLTLDESAEYSGLPASVLRQLVDRGRLPALDVGVRPGGRYRVRRADLDAIEGERLTDRVPSTD